MVTTLREFQPVNDWVPDWEGPRWSYPHDEEPKFIVDQSTGKRYFNESRKCVWIKCFLLALGTPLVHGIAAVINITKKILKVLTLYHFWHTPNDGFLHTFKDRVKDTGKDLLYIVTTPFFLVALELAAVYGLFRVYDGRKLYARLEKSYNSYVLAPCFRPDPTSYAIAHAFGGDANKKNSF